MKRIHSVALLVLFVGLNGCAKDYSLSPPTDSEQIVVTVKVPEGLSARTMQVMYRSPVCRRVTHGASGQRIELDGYQRLDVEPVRLGGGDIYEANLPIDGGGECQWRISNVTFGVVHKDPERFGSDVVQGAGGGVVVVFDHNNSPRGGVGKPVEGDLRIVKDYYPWLSEYYEGDSRRLHISLAAEGSLYLAFQALQARRVYFEPNIHVGFMVSSVQPKEKKKGNHIRFTYPDGSVGADGRAEPNFRKLEAIRKDAESKK